MDSRVAKVELLHKGMQVQMSEMFVMVRMLTKENVEMQHAMKTMIEDFTINSKKEFNIIS